MIHASWRFSGAIATVALVVAAIGCGGGSGGTDGTDGTATGNVATDVTGGETVVTGGPGDTGETPTGGTGGTGETGETGMTEPGGTDDTGETGTGDTGEEQDCAPPPSILSGFTAKRTLYLALTGDDKNDGLTPATAWSTLARVNELMPGDQLDVAAGTYACGGTITVKGTAEAPIWIRSADGPGKAVFDCQEKAGFLVVSSQYLAIDGFEVHNAMGHLFNVFSGPTPPFEPLSHHVLFTHNHLHHAQMACIKSSQSEHIDIVDNDIHHPEAFGANVGGQAIDFVGVNRSWIAQNRIHDVQTNVAVQAKGGAVDVVLEGNEIHDVMTAIHLGGSTGEMYFLPQDADYEGLRTTAINNRLWNVTSVGIAAWGCHDCLIANNTLVLIDAKQPIRGLPGAAGQDAPTDTSYVMNLRLINNLLYMSGGPADLLNLAMGNTEGFTQSHNLFFRTAGAVADAYSDVPVGDANTGTIVDKDPLLVDPAQGDLALGVGSPAIDAGTPVPEVTRDASFGCRNTWNIGAL